MNFYQEITLIPDADISPYFLWSKVYTQLHIALVNVLNQHGIKTIGVSFPNYRYQETEKRTFAFLGDKLRIFAPTKTDLERLNMEKWLDKLTDYIHIKPIKETPKVTHYTVVKRYRQRSLEEKAHKLAIHKNISFTKALQHCKTHKQHRKPYPFINLKSETNDSEYHLTIWQQIVDTPKAGEFNVYGINTMRSDFTVPYW